MQQVQDILHQAGLQTTSRKRFELSLNVLNDQHFSVPKSGVSVWMLMRTAGAPLATEVDLAASKVTIDKIERFEPVPDFLWTYCRSEVLRRGWLQAQLSFAVNRLITSHPYPVWRPAHLLDQPEPKLYPDEWRNDQIAADRANQFLMESWQLPGYSKRLYRYANEFDFILPEPFERAEEVRRKVLPPRPGGRVLQVFEFLRASNKELAAQLLERERQVCELEEKLRWQAAQLRQATDRVHRAELIAARNRLLAVGSLNDRARRQCRDGYCMISESVAMLPDEGLETLLTAVATFDSFYEHDIARECGTIHLYDRQWRFHFEYYTGIFPDLMCRADNPTSPDVLRVLKIMTVEEFNATNYQE